MAEKPPKLFFSTVRQRDMLPFRQDKTRNELPSPQQFLVLLQVILAEESPQDVLAINESLPRSLFTVGWSLGYYVK